MEFFKKVQNGCSSSPFTCIFPVMVNLGEEVLDQLDVLERVEQLEILIVALVSELIARQTENDQVIAVLLQGVQLNKIPDGRASHPVATLLASTTLPLYQPQRQVRALGGRVSVPVRRAS